MKPVQLFPNLQRSLLMAHMLFPATLQNDPVVKALSDRPSRERLLAFCQTDFTSENAWFILAVAQYRASPYWSEAAAIYQLFVPLEAPYQVNIAAHTLATLDRDFAANSAPDRVPPQDLFDEALSEIVGVVRVDMYKRFTGDTVVGLKGIRGNRLERKWERFQRARQAKASLAKRDAQLRQKANSGEEGSAFAQIELDRRPYLKRVLRAASFDLSVMGLA
jgi:hypothetical protein